MKGKSIMKKIEFENAEIIKPAKVSIEGIDYEVTPAQLTVIEKYLSAETLNEMQSNIEESCVAVSPTQPETNEKVWIQKGKNLFNKETALIGYWVKDGKPEYTEDKLTNVLSEYISVSPNTTYTTSGGTLGKWTSVFSYNENKIYYDEIAYINTSETLTFTTGENDYYIRVAFGENLPNIDLIQIEEGSTATEYEPYIEKKIYCKNDNGVFETFIDVEKTKNNINYSTEEQVIGTWLGKPIYRQVVEATITKTTDFLLGTIDNFDTLVNINGYVSISGYVTSLLQYWNDTLKSILQVKKSDGGIYLNSSSSLLNQYVYVIVEYTKTTD